MANEVPVEVLTPEGEVFDDEVEMVSTRTDTGSIGVLANHAPLMGILEPTELRLYKSESDDRAVRAGRGLPAGGGQPRAGARRGGDRAGPARQGRHRVTAARRRAGDGGRGEGLRGVPRATSVRSSATRPSSKSAPPRGRAGGGPGEYRPGTFCWVELATADLEAARGFYPALLGWKQEDDPISFEEPYLRATMGGRPVAAMFDPRPRGTARRDGRPTSQSRRCTPPRPGPRISRPGGDGPFDVRDAARIAVIEDPQGAALGLWQPREVAGAGLVKTRARSR